MPEYMGPDELEATNPPHGRHPMAKQMGGLEPYECNEPLVTFLYLLLRQCVHPGDVEQAACEVEQGAEKGALLSNTFLAEYAQNISDRLIRASETRAKIVQRELQDQMAPPVRLKPPGRLAPPESSEETERARLNARSAAEGRLRAWVNAPMTVPLARVIEQAFAAIGTAEELADLGEVLETVTILTDYALPED